MALHDSVNEENSHCYCHEMHKFNIITK